MGWNSKPSNMSESVLLGDGYVETVHVKARYMVWGDEGRLGGDGVGLLLMCKVTG
jgi:hypothetical protein